MQSMPPFHYAFLVRDLESTRQFYIELLGCTEGRSTESWVDFEFFGHQLSAHISPRENILNYSGSVDGVAVPMPHFGCILPIDVFQNLAERLKATKVNFIIPPQLRYEGKPGEQWTMFFLDYSNNPIEFKAFTQEGEVFAT
jgi:extradiol dioxygenase family protein